MKKVVTLFLVCSLFLIACLETAMHTQISADGSGTMQSSMDMSSMLKMLAGKPGKGDKVINIDTVIYFKNHSDTSTVLTAYQKELLRGMAMQMKVKMDIKDIDNLQFMISISSPFKNLDDLSALSRLMSQKEYDDIFDQALKIPFFEDSKQDQAAENDNLFNSVFPDFYKCEYKKGFVGCSLDKAKHAGTLEDLKKMDFDLEGEMESKMFEAATFSNRITLPSKPKKISGSSIKPGSGENELVQTGNMLDLYRNPERYEYSIQY